MRNLDLTALRSFVAVADSGGVTRAAGFLNLTQSAVSMQLKRLETALDVALLDRSGRGVALTGPGEQLLSYARRMLELNDEIYTRLTHQDYEGEIRLGVPHDIIYPAIPEVLQRLATDYPRVKVQLFSSNTRRLKEQFAAGDCDVILTTEDGCGAGGETLIELPLVWVGAQGGQAWKKRPLRLAFANVCIFRAGVQAALDDAGIPWENTVDSSSARTVEAMISADIAVQAALDGTVAPYLEQIPAGSGLPPLGHKQINLYTAEVGMAPVLRHLSEHLRKAIMGLRSDRFRVMDAAS